MSQLLLVVRHTAELQQERAERCHNQECNQTAQHGICYLGTKLPSDQFRPPYVTLLAGMLHVCHLCSQRKLAPASPNPCCCLQGHHSQPPCTPAAASKLQPSWLGWLGRVQLACKGSCAACKRFNLCCLLLCYCPAFHPSFHLLHL